MEGPHLAFRLLCRGREKAPLGSLLILAPSCLYLLFLPLPAASYVGVGGNLIYFGVKKEREAGVRLISGAKTGGRLAKEQEIDVKKRGTVYDYNVHFFR